VKTTLPKVDEIERRWLLVDATDRPAGRLAVGIANILRGKTKPTYTPHLDTGDFVIVINADKVKLTGGKEEKKIYKHYTGYPSGLREQPARQVRAQNPTRIISQAVRGMLPHNRLGRQQFRKLKVYAGPEHPHQAQQPASIEL
jgi:large subunit ribosomal protein L13